MTLLLQISHNQMVLNLIMMLMVQLLLLITSALFVNGSVFGPKVTSSTQLIPFSDMQCRFVVVHVYQFIILYLQVGHMDYILMVQKVIHLHRQQIMFFRSKIVLCQEWAVNYKENATSLQGTAAWYTAAARQQCSYSYK